MPVLFSTQVLTTDDTGNALNSVFVDDPHCGKIHQHRTATLEPFIRRARCGSRYKVVPIVSAVEYGTDHRDADLWADEDGVVRYGDGTVRIPEQQSRTTVRAAA